MERNLLPNESVVYKTRIHWVRFMKPVLLLLAGVLLGAALWRVADPPGLWYLGAAVALGALLWLGVRWVELMTSEFAVTTTRLIFKVGLVARYTTELLLTKVETIGVNQGLLGRILNYGDLTVTGTGGAREVFHLVRDPIGFRNCVQQASIGSRPGAGEPPR